MPTVELWLDMQADFRSRSPARHGRLISIRAGLLSSMLGLLVVLGAASMLGLLYSGSRLLKRTADTVIVAREAQAAVAVEEFFQPAKTQTLAAEHWALSGLLSATDTEAARRSARPISVMAETASAWNGGLKAGSPPLSRRKIPGTPSWRVGPSRMIAPPGAGSSRAAGT
jgi:hypothetical protein